MASVVAPGVKEKVCIIGSGNWGSAIARIVGQNAAHKPNFDTAVKIWVYEEMVNGRKLTEIINTEHENVKYLPGIQLPPNVEAVPDLKEAARGATMLIFVLPHQFLKRLLPQVRAVLHPKAKAISLIKGIDFNDKGLVLISDLIREGLGLDCGVLMGANVANEVAKDQFCEATVGCHDPEAAKLWVSLFNLPTFRVHSTTDCAGVELCGALKNIVAIGAGFCDGLGYGGNTKASVIRIGLMEMKRFCAKFYDGVRDDTFFESCGVADLITTCFGGRNRKCADAYVRTGKRWEIIEEDLLGGQKLQGTLTAHEVHKVLDHADAVDEFPLFSAVYRVSYEGVNPTKFLSLLKPHKPSNGDRPSPPTVTSRL